jgi:hypothetical protein
MFFQPSMTFLALESAFIGVALSLLGLLIQRLIERYRARTVHGREVIAPAGQAMPDPGLVRSISVGSDDSTAIRVRVPSTVDYVAAPASPAQAGDEGPSSALERA